MSFGARASRGAVKPKEALINSPTNRQDAKSTKKNAMES